MDGRSGAWRGRDGCVPARRLTDAKVRRGRADTSESGSIDFEFFVPRPRLAEQVLATTPSERTIFFLRRKTDLGEPMYMIVNQVQGYYRDLAGVEPPVGSEDDWVLELRGTSFDDLLQTVSDT